MKELTLYIDRWYIIGAVCTDGVPRLIEMPNHEDRFWLYFYEDVNNDRIIYGKDNERHWRDGEIHYYGDIFSLITNPDLTFMRFGHPLAIEEIFQSSGLFEDLKSSWNKNNSNVAAYVSFSEDIKDAERLIFLHVLENNGFQVKESVAHIEHLALEYGSHQRNKFKEDGYYLVLNACNENLHYSLYKHAENMFVRGEDKSLAGYGNDLRSRALLEAIIDSVNRRNGFLKTKAEKEEECMRMYQYIDNWLVKLDHARPTIPITISNVTFSKQPFNKFSVSIIKKNIDERTSGIVMEIIREVSSFVKESNIKNEEVKGVLFIGNTFTNGRFVQSVQEKFLIDKDELVIFRDSNLPYIVSVYSVIDCKQFSLATSDFKANSEQELQRLRIAKEEKERQERAQKEILEQQTLLKQVQEKERNYKNAIDKIQEFEEKNDYENMKEWCEVALRIKPDDNIAKVKLDEANQKNAEEAAIAKQYNLLIQQANNSFREGRWVDALSQSNAALNVRQTTEAQKIKEESSHKLSILSDIKDYLTRADIFEAQQSFNEAINELQKVLALDENNKEAKRRFSLINKKIEEKSLKLVELVNKENTAETRGEYAAAMKFCEDLMAIDADNIAKWSGKIQTLRIRKETIEKETQHLSQIKSKIDNAMFNDDWQKVVSFCEEALRIKPDSDIEKKLGKAKERFLTTQKNQKFQHEYDAVKALIVDKKWEEAQQKINEMSRDYPEKLSMLKDLRKMIFDADVLPHTENKTGKRKVVNGFSNTNDKTNEDDFFSSDSVESRKKETKRRKISHVTITPNKENGDDFFNLESPNKRNNIKSISNDDFNF